MKFYPIQKNWSRKIKPHLANEAVQAVLVRDFNKFTYGRWKKEFRPGMKPTDFESCDWRCGRRGRQPEFWDYTKHAACHWLVNFNRKLAELVEPKREWRIVSSQEHSTVRSAHRSPAKSALGRRAAVMRLARLVFAAMMLDAPFERTHAGDTPVPSQQAPPPSLLEPVKPLTDAYAAGLAACYGWPTATGVWWCKVDQFIDLLKR